MARLPSCYRRAVAPRGRPRERRGAAGSAAARGRRHRLRSPLRQGLVCDRAPRPRQACSRGWRRRTDRRRPRPLPRADPLRAPPRPLPRRLESSAITGPVGSATPNSVCSRSGASSGSSISTCFCMPRTSEFLQMIERDRFLGDLAQRDDRVLVVVAVEGQRRAGRDLARPLRGEQHQLEAVRDLDDAIFDRNARHAHTLAVLWKRSIYGRHGSDRNTGHRGSAATRIRRGEASSDAATFSGAAAAESRSAGG